MTITDSFYQDVQNLTTATIINSFNTVSSGSYDDNNDMTRILPYAIPLSCLSVLMVILLAIGIHRRHHVLERWTSLKEMRNTDPRFIECSGLRRDSEYDTYTDGFVNVTIINEDEHIHNEPELRLATIT